MSGQLIANVYDTLKSGALEFFLASGKLSDQK